MSEKRGYWFRNIAPYLGDDDYQTSTELKTSGVMKVGICPSTKIQTEDDDGTAPDNKSTWYWSNENIIGSYAINAWIQPDPDGYAYNWGSVTEEEAEKRMFGGSMARVPGNVGIIAEAYRMDNWPSTPADVRVPTIQQLTEPDDESIDHTLQTLILRYTVNRHDMAVNVAYADGSASKVRLEDLYMIKWNNYDGPVDIQIPSSSD